MSEDSVKFVQTMDDENATDEQRISAMKSAIAYQSKIRLECTAGLGCDRHMLGLLCAARELGMDIPRVFSDKVINQYSIKKNTNNAEYST